MPYNTMQCRQRETRVNKRWSSFVFSEHMAADFAIVAHRGERAELRSRTCQDCRCSTLCVYNQRVFSFLRWHWPGDPLGKGCTFPGPQIRKPTLGMRVVRGNFHHLSLIGRPNELHRYGDAKCIVWNVVIMGQSLIVGGIFGGILRER